MALAQIGLFTSGLEVGATAVGAGIVLGGASMGAIGLVLGWSRREIGDRALTDGYIGGLVGLLALVADLFIRYVF
jgi:hypothetical protein